MNESKQPSQQDIVRPRLSQLELFILQDLTKQEMERATYTSKKAPYYKQLRKLNRKLKRNIKIRRFNYDVKSNRVPYVKSEAKNTM